MRAIAAAVPTLLLAGCGSNSSFLNPYGPVASAQRDLFLSVIGWMAIVVLPVFVLTPLFAWRYRRRNTDATYRPDWQLSKPLEILIWGVPMLIVAVLAFAIWTVKLDPYAPVSSSEQGQEDPLVVQVVGLDWEWLFIYPQYGIATVGRLGLPVDRPVRFELTSDATMMSFWIPALGSQIYAMAGMVTELNLLADRPGELYGANTQFNGTGFARQRFVTSALPKEDFSRFVETVRAEGTPLDESAYDILSRKAVTVTTSAALPSEQEDPGRIYFSSVKPDLFRSILAKYMADPDLAECTPGSEARCAIEASAGHAHRNSGSHDQ